MNWLRRLAGHQPAATAGFRTDAAAFSDVGLVRPINEDRTLLALQPLGPGCGIGDRVSLAALADGMGGHQAGEIASDLALETAQQVLRAAAKLPAPKALAEAMNAANAAVYAEAQRRPEEQGMGTTLALLLLREDAAYYAWLGDSRIYHLHLGQMRQLSEDDTLVRHMVSDGTLTEAAALTHPDRNVLAQAMGTHPRISRLHVAGPVPIVAGDSFMLCSDGLHDVVSDSRIARLLQDAPAAESCRLLIEEAKRCRSEDNISVAVVRILLPLEQPVDAVAPALRSTVVRETSV